MAKIGIFDSGYGGLTILEAIRRELPQYDYLYLGDNARAPYGTHSFDVIYRYTLQAVNYLLNSDCSLVILACNTASAKALRTIQQHDLPLINAERAEGRRANGRPANVLGVIRPTVEAMVSEGRPFKGCLYFGLMLTPDGPKVIEYNCRFGDPETQVVLPLLQSDLLTVMQAVTNGTLRDTPVTFADAHACCVIMASSGYPLSYEKGYEITIPAALNDAVYVAGAKLADGKLLTSGGRVLGVTAVEGSLKEAVASAYAKVEQITFGNAFYRRDIGARALAAAEE